MTDDVEIHIQSILPEGEPQGTVVVSVAETTTADALISQFCQEKSIDLRPDYAISTQQGTVLLGTQSISACGIQNGSTVYIIHKDIETKKPPFGCNQWWLLAGVCLFIGGAGIVAVSIIHGLQPKPVYEYGIVFDAGSSHTTMFIYKWAGAKTNGTAIAKQTYLCNSLAITSFENEPYKAGISLEACLMKAKEQIPKDRWPDSRVYLGATAGMRMLNEVNRNISESILDSIRYSISKFPFSFINGSLQARIISGSEEGSFSWITTNYLSGTLHVDPVANSAYPSIIRSSDTFGALDLGGASTQITFAPAPGTVLPPSSEFNMYLYGQNYSLYTHSYLCYGINEAMRRFKAQLIKEQNYSLTVMNPCGPSGNSTFSGSADIFHAPCVKNTAWSEAGLWTWSTDIDVANEADAGNETDTYEFVGVSNSSECRKHVERLFNFSTPCPYGDGNCSFAGVYQPEVLGDYFAFSTYFYLLQFLNLTSPPANTTASLEEFLDATTTLCNSTWEQVKYMPTSYSLGLPMFCFESVFIQFILTEGYGFNETNWQKIHFLEKIKGNDLGWSLGFMLSSSNAIPAIYAEENLSLVLFILMLILFIIFLAIAIGFACYARRHNRLKRGVSTYERLDSYGSLPS